jgi:protein O-GlcNAc transferase
LSVDSFDIESEIAKAVHYHKAGQLQKAESIYLRILEIDQKHAGSLMLLGLISDQLGRTDQAVNLMRKAIQNDPDNPVYYNNLGNALQAQGKFNEAISCYQKAVKLRRDYAEAYSNLGNAFQNQGESDEALSCCQKAVRLRPDFAAEHNNMGNAFLDQGKFNEAISCYRKVLQLTPDHFKAYYNMGNAFLDQGKPDNAASCYQKAVELKQDYAEAHNNLGIAFQNQDMSDEAIVCFERALELRPDLVEAYGHLFYELQQTCAWEKLESLAVKLDRLTKSSLDKAKKPAEQPFLSLVRHADLFHNLAVSRAWSLDVAKRMSKLKIHFSFDHRRVHKTKIIVGYLSNDFCDSPTAHLMLSLFGLHCRDKFEIFCYSYGQDDGSAYASLIRRDCDKFVDMFCMNYDDAARLINEDQVDILVDLKGYTRGNRLAICALHPAPIQVTYLGFPGTTGANFFDYIITDRIVTPENHSSYYTESFVYMPHCFMVSDYSQAISNNDWKKAEFGLSESTFIFSSFNRPHKIEPTMFGIWMKVLSKVPDSALWLQQMSETAQSNLRREAQKRGVRPERLIFAERFPFKKEHLARLRLSDVALDTRIHNGHVTTNDALWSGVPVITLEGTHFASRVSSSLLSAVGLPELITHTSEEYEALAVRLARNPEQLQVIRQKLERNRLKEPLFDTPRFVRNLEKAYEEMWQIFLAREKLRQIDVVEN